MIRYHDGFDTHPKAARIEMEAEVVRERDGFLCLWNL